jgi:hypothetical protein
MQALKINSPSKIFLYVAFWCCCWAQTMEVFQLQNIQKAPHLAGRGALSLLLNA